MTAYLVHRGPDSAGFHTKRTVALGMRRLSIIDRAHGQQPIYNETGDIAVVFNGEIYNHQVLRDSLVAAGHKIPTHSDTEVLVHGYEEWGIEGLLERLNGMFAFALHDESRRLVFVARDRVGIKPLYVTKTSGSVIFASEIKAFRAIKEVTFRLNQASLPDYLSLRYVPGTDTLFKGIEKLPSGHFICIDEDGETKCQRYWYPKTDKTQRSDEEHLEQFTELFQDAVKIRLMSEVPIGAYLSEGLDSNMIVDAMAKNLTSKVHTYSIGFGGAHDETESARLSAETLGTDHTEIMFDTNSFSELADAIWSLDEPIGDAHILPSYVLAREAKKKLTVVLLGEGADESLYGYPFYKVSWIARRALSMLPASVRSAIPGLVERMPLSALNAVFPMPAELGAEGRRHLASFMRIAADGNGQDIFRQLSGLFGPGDLSELLLGDTTTRGFNTGLFGVDQDARDPDTLLKQISEAQFSGWLQDNVLLRHDKMAMAHSIECRVPFLDHRLIEFMQGVPRRLKVSGWKDKVLSRRYAERQINKEIAYRPKKPFYLPLDQFTKTKAYADLVGENLSESRVRSRGLFRHSAVSNLVKRVGTGDFLAAKRVMSLIIFEIWMRTFIDGELAKSPS